MKKGKGKKEEPDKVKEMKNTRKKTVNVCANEEEDKEAVIILAKMVHCQFQASIIICRVL